MSGSFLISTWRRRRSIENGLLRVRWLKEGPQIMLLLFYAELEKHYHLAVNEDTETYNRYQKKY